jgi:hypothetical protein
MRNLQLEAVIKLRDMAMRPLQAFQRQTNESSKALKEMRDRLKEIERNQATINHFKNLKNQLNETTQSLAQANAKTKNLAQQLQAAKAVQSAHTQAVNIASQRVNVLTQHQAQHTQEMRQAQARVKALTEQIRAQKNPSAAMREELRQTKLNLKNLSQEQQNYQQRLKEAKVVLKAATTELTQQSRAIKLLNRDFHDARKSAHTLSIEQKQQHEQLQRLRDSLKQAGISTNNLSEHQRRLNRDTQQANQTIAQQQLRLARLADSEKRLGELRNQYRQSQTNAMNMGMTGHNSLNTGRTIVASIFPMVNEAKEYQTQLAKFRAQGATESEVQQAIHFSKHLNIKGSSQLENLKLLTEANTMLRDFHEAEHITPMLAKMKFGIETVLAKAGQGEGHGTLAEQMFMDAIRVAELRGALITPEMFKDALNKMTQSYVSSLGMVTPTQLLDAIKTGGTAAKMLNDESFYFGLNHMIQESGGNRVGTSLMSGFQNFAMGRTTQQAAEDLVAMGLMKPDFVKYGTTGHVKKVKVGGLKQIDSYLKNPFKFLNETLIPTINPKGTLSDDEVVFKIASLFSSRKGGDFFVQMFKERKNIKKHTDAAYKAFGVEGLYDEANKTAKGEEIDWVAKKMTYIGN